MKWQDVDQKEETEKQLHFWVKKPPKQEYLPDHDQWPGKNNLRTGSFIKGLYGQFIHVQNRLAWSILFMYFEKSLKYITFTSLLKFINLCFTLINEGLSAVSW